MEIELKRKIISNSGLFIFLLVTLWACGNPKEQESDEAQKIDETSSSDEFARTKPIEVVNYQELEQLFSKESDKTLVVNFWATWCKPCIEEMPYFEEVQDSLAGKDLQVMLVSLDLPKQYESNLVPFVEKHSLISRVIMLNDPRENEWIPRIDSTWSGAIPATLLIKGNRRAFFEGSFTRETLFETLDEFINTQV